MDQISIKIPDLKCGLFLKIDQKRYLAAGVYLSQAPVPLPPPFTTLYEYIPLYLYLGRGGRGVCEPVGGKRALVHKRGRKYQHD
jgi:hypothetical protein